MTIDIDATWTEPFLLVRPLTLDGECWLDERIEGEATWDGDTLLVEHRFGPDILVGAHEDGLTVALDGEIADVPRTMTPCAFCPDGRICATLCECFRARPVDGDA